jgi:predicted nucleic-acid-binding protein
MFILDTNILVNILVKDFNVLGPKEKEILNKVKLIDIEDLIIPSFVLTELLLVIKRVMPKRLKLSKKNSTELYKNSLDFIYNKISEHVLIENPSRIELRKAIELNQKDPNTDLTFIDILIQVMAKERSLDVITLDRKLFQSIKRET